jgi:UDP-GlcNAc3NAcA epimerase
MEHEQPDIVITRGDTNSTLAGALAASKLNIPMAHIEAGERSYDRTMPEEINRLVTDSLADLHFCASLTATRRLATEGIHDTVYFVGDVMLDALQQNMPVARRNSQILGRLGVEPSHYALVTIHRAANTDDPARLGQIVAALNRVDETIVFPVHPRTRAALQRIDAELAQNVIVIDPVGYFDMMLLEQNARLIATDSGGVQREAYFMAVPCLTLRDETEWTETVETGWNKLVGATTECIVEDWFRFSPPAEHPAIFGDGTASRQIAAILHEEFPRLRGRHKLEPAVAAREPAAHRIKPE